ncbi:MAG: LON peptidase substrate-binding domain-containing protein [Acidobacteria bacterium]|nr:LON peptidase substrate-binding domain-containing protein [Acidobacteriota bacterium]MBI3280168.1 LON peptidase substrate-binding domain-containing protein [Acidobacteriota bacterium]
MQEALLPLFPLQIVLFPRTFLPLHIFEDRYKELIGGVLQNHGEFGVVQASEKGIMNMGCTATVEKVLRQYPDGRMDIFAVGRRRFEILTLDEERSFLQGRVVFFDDEPGEDTPREVKRKALAQFRRLRAMGGVSVAGEPRLQDPQLSFQIAQLVSDLDFRQMMLATRSESDRMRQLTEFLPGYIARQAHAAHVKAVAPRNGHGRIAAPDAE